MTARDAVTAPVACNRDCGGGCPLLATVAGGRVVRIADNPAGGQYLRGCVRGFQAWRQQQAEDRLTHPLVRTGPRGSGRFREAGWEEAIRLVAEGLARVRERHGDASILALGGSGSCRGALHDTEDLTARYLNLSGGHVEQTSTYSSAASSFTQPVVLGTQHAGVDPATLRHSSMIVLWGANLVDCIMGCEWRARVREAKARGVPVVVIDPRRTTTARLLGTEWLPVLPGTDSALMLALLHELITAGAVDEPFVAAHATGYDALRRRVLGLDSGGGAEVAPPAAGGAATGPPRGAPATPEWAAGVCGVPAARIRALARAWARHRPVALAPGLSIQRTLGGEEAVRLAIALQTVTGDLGRPGGSSGGRAWGGLPQASRGQHPGAAQSCGRRHPLQRLGRRRAARPRRRPPRGRQGRLRHRRQLRGPGRGRRSEHPRHARARVLSLPRPLPDDDGPLLRRRAPGHALAGAQRHRLHLGRLPAVLAARGLRSGAGQGRLRHLRRPGRGERVRRGVHGGPRLGGVAGPLPGGLRGRRSEDFRLTGIHWGADRERVGLAEFSADPAAAPLATPSGRVELAGAACAAAGLTEVPESRVLEPTPESPLSFISPKSRLRVHTQFAALPWVRERDDRCLY